MKKIQMTLLTAVFSLISLGTMAQATMTVNLKDGTSQTFEISNIDNVAWAEPEQGGCKAVDLGLSVKWADMNLGATKAEEYGSYFAWGETATKDDYSWAEYFDVEDGATATSYYKYANDKKTVLDIEDDAAHVILGGDWRMPTKDEMTELQNNCTWEWTTQNDIKGYKVTGTNGNSIFLPAAGYYSGTKLRYAGSAGLYWTSALGSSSQSKIGYDLYFSSSQIANWGDYRMGGQSIRPVCQ